MKQQVIAVDEILPTLDVSSPLRKIGFLDSFQTCSRNKCFNFFYNTENYGNYGKRRDYVS